MLLLVEAWKSGRVPAKERLRSARRSVTTMRNVRTEHADIMMECFPGIK
jgi:hypothetical protein